MPFGADLRSEFVLDPSARFLNNGSFGATPRAVLAVQDGLRAEMEHQPVKFMDGVEARLGQVSARVARFLGSDPANVVFVDNATSGVNAILQSLALRPGDSLLTTSHVYPAVRNAMHFVAGRAGATVLEIPVDPDDPEAVVAAVARGLPDRCRLAVFDQISSPTAAVFPLKELIHTCRLRGVPVLVDGAHAPGQLPVDLAELDPDYWVGNLHKWLFAPKGTAALFVRPEHQGGLHPAVISHGWGQGFQREFAWSGTRDPSNWLAAGAALDFAEGLGIPALRQYQRHLRDRAVGLLDAAGWSPRLRRWESLSAPAMVTLEPPFAIPGTREACGAINRALWERHRIEIPVFPFAGRGWIRISTHVFNALSEYEALRDAIGPDGVR